MKNKCLESDLEFLASRFAFNCGSKSVAESIVDDSYKGDINNALNEYMHRRKSYEEYTRLQHIINPYNKPELY